MWLGFSPWPSNFHMLQVQPKKRKRKKFKYFLHRELLRFTKRPTQQKVEKDFARHGFFKVYNPRVPIVAQRLMNPASNHEDTGLIPGPALWAPALPRAAV